MGLAEELTAEHDRAAMPQAPVYAQTSSFTVKGDEANFVLPPGAGVDDIDRLLRERGLDPDDWHVQTVTVNEWDALAHGGGADGEPRVVKLRQLKVTLRNRKYAVGQAVEVERRHRPKASAKRPKRRPLTVVVLGDQQAPYHDEGLHQAVLRWLATHQPDELVLTGDTCDFPTISRHRDRINWNASAQECVNVGYRLLSDYADASPKTRRRKLRGNHDWRLESELMDRAERMAFLAPAEREGKVVPHLYSIKRLLHLDDLGYELVGEEGEDWRMGEAQIAPGIDVRHEPPALSKVPKLASSILAGHTHRQGVEMVTVRNEHKAKRVLSIVHTGCLCRTEEGLGFAVDADWQAGFATATIWPDGSASFDLATWRGGELTWRGERW